MKNRGNKKLKFKFILGLGLIALFVAAASSFAENGMNDMEIQESQEGMISVEFKDADVQDVFRVLSLKGNVNIVSDPDVKGLISIHITDVPWEKILDVICRTYSYAYEREGNIIRVTTLDKQGLETLITEVFPLNYARAQDVVFAVEEMKSERGKVKFDARSNLIIVTDIPTNIYKIGKVIQRLDAMTPQVTIQAKIIETSLTTDERLGLKWNPAATATMSKRVTTFPWGADGGENSTLTQFMPVGENATDFPTQARPSFPYASKTDFTYGVLDATSFSLMMEAITSRGKTRILSNPSITTMDNQEAEIHVGTDWPIASYSYNEETDRFVITGWEYKSYGVLLRVTPTINKDGFVTLKLHPEISDKQDVVNFQGAEVPILSTQTTDATVMIKDGETLVIGGLLKDKTVTTKTKVPILGDIPILGLLFTHKADAIEKKDLLIFITPHIINRDQLERRKEAAEALIAARQAAEEAQRKAEEAAKAKAMEEIKKKEEMKEAKKKNVQPVKESESIEDDIVAEVVAADQIPITEESSEEITEVESLEAVESIPEENMDSETEPAVNEAVVNVEDDIEAAMNKEDQPKEEKRQNKGWFNRKKH
ncbi:MAG: secretin N-terminal domain-containing protein [Candidatus Omnitrophota bacterium]